jgi:hypothetical protein
LEQGSYLPRVQQLDVLVPMVVPEGLLLTVELYNCEASHAALLLREALSVEDLNLRYLDILRWFKSKKLPELMIQVIG